MEVLNDYPKEFAKLLRPSFNRMSNVNIRFLAKDESFSRKNWRYAYVIPCIMINQVTLCWSLTNMVAKREFLDIALLLPPFFVSTQAILKTITLVRKTSSLNNIIVELGDLWRTTELDEIKKNARELLLKKVNFCNGMIYYAGLIGVTQYLMLPLVETLVRQLILNQDFDRILALKCVYPFNVSDNWFVYLIVYGFQTYSMLLCFFAETGSEMLMVTLCALLGVEFTLLGEDITRIKPSKMRAKLNVVLEDGEINREVTLRDIAQRHQKLCILSNRLNNAFNQMIFIFLLFVGLTTCVFVFASQFSRGLTYIFCDYVAVVAFFLYVLYMCYYGEVLTGASLRIGDMAYHYLWYESDIQQQKIILCIIMRSQKQCCLTSLNYTPVTLNLFTKVIYTSWSYLSLMNTAYNQN